MLKAMNISFFHGAYIFKPYFLFQSQLQGTTLTQVA